MNSKLLMHMQMESIPSIPTAVTELLTRAKDENEPFPLITCSQTHRKQSLGIPQMRNEKCKRSGILPEESVYFWHVLGQFHLLSLSASLMEPNKAAWFWWDCTETSDTTTFLFIYYKYVFKKVISNKKLNRQVCMYTQRLKKLPLTNSHPTQDTFFSKMRLLNS